MWKNGRNDSRKIRGKTKKEYNMTEICEERQNTTSSHTHRVCCFLLRRSERKTQQGNEADEWKEANASCVTFHFS